jgi:hypothetical protein
VFYAVANQVTVIIQEAGQASLSSGCNRTWTANPSAAEPEYMTSSYALVFAAGMVLGSAIMYIIVRRSRKLRREP